MMYFGIVRVSSFSSVALDELPGLCGGVLDSSSVSSPWIEARCLFKLSGLE